MSKSISFCKELANLSTQFETNTSDLKKRYLLENIKRFNELVAEVKVNRGSFGTGYPFYALGPNLSGELPIISEQIRYNNELKEAVNSSCQSCWICYDCLNKNGALMPDLKQICKPCPNIEDSLKPRKVINRLPDIDMWMICNAHDVEYAKQEMAKLFNFYNMHPSDIEPIRTFEDIQEIINDLENGIMPSKMLPLDAHIIDYETLLSLVSQIPSKFYEATLLQQVPYLPIHPYSYRKIWQHDDTAYNFVHDYLCSFTEFGNISDELIEMLEETRSIVAENYTVEELYECLMSSGVPMSRARFKTPELKSYFAERVNSWRR